MKLWDIKKNQRSTIKDIQSDLPQNYRDRLNDLGFEIGEPIVCLRRPPFGAPRIYRVGDSVFCLAHDLAAAITVEVIP